MCGAIDLSDGFGAPPLDTLETIAPNDKNETSYFEKKRNLKAINTAIHSRLLALGDNEMTKSYKAAYSCRNNIKIEGGKITTITCKSRSCNICNRKKMAVQIAKYGDAILSMDDLYFVTLSSVNVSGPKLKDEYRRMAALWKTVYNLIRKEGLKINGIRKLETTYNHKINSYHPHYHIIVSGARVAQMLLDKWMQNNTEKVDRQCQDIKPVTKEGEEGSVLLELFKYVTKADSYKDQFNARSMHTIYLALKGKRTIEPMGKVRLNAVKDVDLSNEIKSGNETIQLLKWCYNNNHWYNIQTQEMLSKEPLKAETKQKIQHINNAEKGNTRQGGAYNTNTRNRKNRHNRNERIRNKGKNKRDWSSAVFSNLRNEKIRIGSMGKDNGINVLSEITTTWQSRSCPLHFPIITKEMRSGKKKKGHNAYNPSLCPLHFPTSKVSLNDEKTTKNGY